MKVIYQPINFDHAKAKEVVDALESHPDDLLPLLETIVLGDQSCTFRNHLFYNLVTKDNVFREFRDYVRAHGVRTMFQLPLVTKQSELEETKEIITRWWDDFDGFVTGDLGVISYLDRRIKEEGADKALIFTSNVLNTSFSEYLKEKFDIERLRPLFHKRTFIEESVGFDKDVVVYGHMMINSSTFCFHCGDLPTGCDFSCTAPKKLIMEHELVHMVGRSLITENRLDLLDRLEDIPSVASVTIMDLELTMDEIIRVFERVHAQQKNLPKAAPTQNASAPPPS